ncbi:MAG: PKD domain-containing protein, partial [Bacteroidota bacterium]
MAQSWDCYSSSTWWNNDTPMLFISSQIAAVVTIDAPDIAFTRTVTLIPNQTYSLLLPREVVCRYSDTITQNGVHVTSDDIINVYAVNRFWYSKGATVVIPTTSIVKSPEYIITTDEDTYNWNWSCNGKNFRSPEFVIVGVADSSVIEIVPKGASTRNSIANVPFQITLKKGETFQYMSTDVDLTGSIIRSKYPDSKYSVFAGNRLTVKQGVDANGGTCYSSFDHNYEQMTPTVTWGNKYTAIPFKNSEGGYYLKVVAAENNTRISINGTYYKTLNQAQYFEYMLYTDTLTTISSTNRISVAQFVKGYNCIKHPTKPYLGDPAQMQLFPDEQFGNNATVNTVSQTNYWWWNNNPWWWQNAAPEHFINVMVKTGDTAEFKINNNKVPGSEWKGFSTGNQYAYTQIKIDSGSHYMSSTKGFLSYVYGYGWFEGYAYAAAAKFRPIQNNFIITNAQCKKDTVNFQAIENDSFGNFTWKFGDGATASGPKVKHKYADTGWYSVKMYCRHVITNVLDSVQKDLYIADTKIKSLFNKDTAICGPVNIIVLTKGFNMDNTYRWNDGHQVYYRAIKNPGINWCEVTERNGCVFRDTLKITNSGIPKANFSVSNDTFCLNKSDNITFKNLSVSKDTIESYKWDFGEKTLSSFDTVLSYKFKNANTYAVMLKATTIYGCYHDTFQIVDVMTSPKADFSFTQKDTCYIKNGIRLQNNTVIPDVKDLKRFKWYFSEGFNISNSNPAGVRTYATPGNYKVMLIYEYKNLCIDTMVQSLTIYPHPKAAFSVISPSMCTLDSIKFKATSQSAYKPLYNQWVWGDSTANKNSFDSFAKHPYAKFGSYNVKLISTSPQGCTDTIKHLISLDESPKISFLTNRDTQCYRGHS